jgi:hypothetical protein
MVEAVYDELDPGRARELDAHVGGCAACGALLDEMRATAALMSRRRRPDPGQGFWDAYWQRLEERVVRDESGAADVSRFGRRRSFGSWGYRAAAVVALLAAGVWVGRLLAPDRAVQTASPGVESAGEDLALATTRDTTRDDEGEDVALRAAPQPIDADAPTGERTTDRRDHAPAPAGVLAASDDEALRYIERSQVLLIALVNGAADDDEGSVVPAIVQERERAGVLMREAAEIRAHLDARGDRRLRELVSQLELILREIAHLEADADFEAVDVIRSRLDREGVLLRINLEQMRESATVPASESNGAID